MKTTTSRASRKLALVLVAAGFAFAATAPVFALPAQPAGAQVAADSRWSSLLASCVAKDAADGDTANGSRLPYRLCDDGVPAFGGITPNPDGAAAVKVPAKYGGNGYTALPAKAADASTMPGADANGDVALDVNLSLPPTTMTPPPGGFPILVFMHGWGSGSKKSWTAATIQGGNDEKWHDNNAWFASRGYVVLNYTARGFVDANNHGSTGETQLDNRKFEVNDYQYLAGLAADEPDLHADGRRVAVMGGSYGGGFTWLALTDPIWTSPGAKPMRLAAAVPKYGWTDLVNSLIPNGRQSSDPAALSDSNPARAVSLQPIGIEKLTIVNGLFATAANASTDHTTVPRYLAQALICLDAGEPYTSASPQCAGTLPSGDGTSTLDSIIQDRSAYYQQDFFTKIATRPAYRVPVFSAGTFYDPLFPTVEHARMANRLRATVPGYPIKEYYGDYQHLYAQNKAKEWDDVCGGDHHVCTLADYIGGLNADPAGLVRTGVNTMINRFLDHYLTPPANPSEPTPKFDTTAALRTCAANATSAHPADEPGETFTARTLQKLAPHRLNLTFAKQAMTANPAPSINGADADPVLAERTGHKCVVASQPAGPGAAVYESAPLTRTAKILGVGRISISYQAPASDLELNARLYDVRPDGSAVLIDRGAYRPTAGATTADFELLGAAWPVPAGDRLRVEVVQDDAPFLRADNVASTATISGVKLSLPIR